MALFFCQNLDLLLHVTRKYCSKEKLNMSQFIVCTDAGLSSNTNRYFNQYDKEDGTRDFITTQSVKKLKGYLKNGPWRRKVGGSLEATAGPHII